MIALFHEKSAIILITNYISVLIGMLKKEILWIYRNMSIISTR